jgi:hypothetical protein
MIIGSARIDERGKINGGAAGDQKQSKTPDYSGEVSMQTFYVHRKGWYVIRPKKSAHAENIASKMQRACNNPNLGYDQYNRFGVITYGIGTNKKTECDCSSLVRACVKEGTGKDPGNFSTADEVAVLERTGLFERQVPYTNGMTLYNGDILVTKTKGHTAIVVSGNPRKTTGKPIDIIAKEIIAGKWGNGNVRKQKLKEAGYNPDEVQKVVNSLL